MEKKLSRVPLQVDNKQLHSPETLSCISIIHSQTKKEIVWDRIPNVPDEFSDQSLQTVEFSYENT